MAQSLVCRDDMPVARPGACLNRQVAVTCRDRKDTHAIDLDNDKQQHICAITS